MIFPQRRWVVFVWFRFLSVAASLRDVWLGGGVIVPQRRCWQGPSRNDVEDTSRSLGFSPGTNSSSAFKSPVFFEGWGRAGMTPRTKTVAWALARATYAPHHPKNTAFFHQRKSVSHSHSTFVPRVRNARATFCRWSLSWTHCFCDGPADRPWPTTGVCAFHAGPACSANKLGAIQTPTWWRSSCHRHCWRYPCCCRIPHLRIVRTRLRRRALRCGEPQSP